MALPVTVLPELTTPVYSAVLDSGVLLKLTKHTSESFPSTVCGLLLGLDADSVLQLTHAFPFPADSSASSSDDTANPRSKINLRYQADMIRLLKEVNIEVNPVGFYISSYLGGFFTQTLVDSLVSFHASNPNSIVLVHDVTKSSQGSLSLKAYRLSEQFLAANKASGGKFSSEAVVKHELTYLDILEELPLSIKNSHLATTLLQHLDSPAFAKKDDPSTLLASSTMAPNFDTLELSIDPYLEKNVEFLIDSVDDYYAEQGTFNYFQRQLSREQAKIQQWVQKTKTENALRERAGLPTVSEDDWQKQFKLPTEPSRLDNLLISAQINQYCNQIEEYGSVVSAKMFAIQNGLDINN
ncbi:hypothetical protein BZA70DRAFT_277844 [Myxozyma melibiosi]|uniref:Eukaryotic translation initiation factor 3 subunit H n=1 Tax=Myxozyma melibiosi TaxID=54550 RepID=A0ABR1F6A1_9ASCO